MSRSRLGWVACVTALSVLGSAVSARADVTFQEHIKPLLQKHCVSCHGEDLAESGLRLDFGSFITQGGDRGTLVVPGKADESLLLQALIGKGNVKAMPLDSPRLKDAEIEVVRTWINAGAKLPSDDAPGDPKRRKSEHWSFQPIRRPALPTVQRLDWPVNAIDYFILARLEKEKLAPSVEADRATLVRRLYLDALGVLPTPSEADEFVNDPQAGAYERLVDRVLASPRYGERWGRHWMDMARYADSNGFTIDGPRSIWPFRDWVINALNADMPYDQFATEQLAGDLIPNASREQLVATGFHRNTLINQEGGTDQEQFRNEAVVDRVSTTSAIFFGLTVGCAQCHAHKYDPITQREFYEFFAFFNNCDEPNIPLPTAQQAEQQQAIKELLAKVAKELKAHDARRSKDQVKWQEEVAGLPPTPWTPLKPSQMTSQAGAAITTDDGEHLLIGGNGNVPATDVYTLVSDVEGKISAVRLEALTNQVLTNQGPGWTAEGNFVMTEFELGLTEPGAKKPRKLEIRAATTDWSQDGYSIEQTLDNNKKSGWSIGGVKHGSLNVNREAIYVLREPINAAAGSKLTVTMKFEHKTEKALLGYWRLATTDLVTDKPMLPNSVGKILKADAKDRTDADKAVLAFVYGSTDQSRKPLEQQQAKLKQEETELTAAIPTTMVLQEKTKGPRQSYIHVRGDFLNKGADVKPGVPGIFPPLGAADNAAATRLDFTRWMFSPDHPLTARVTVNRFWQQFFGVGLVDTENDFGTQGSSPTHPELLDWLASEMHREQWSLKQLHRLIVTSATYRQASSLVDSATGKPLPVVAADPYNRLLGRQRRVRLEAEQIRDAALASSGLLSQKMLGPGVYPPQPKGIYVVTQVAKAWPESQGDDRYRRGLYTYFWRSSPYPMLPTFDAPDANGTCTRRNRSNTPLQALTLANDGSFMELARGFSDRILKEASASDEARLNFAAQAALSRRLSESELDRLLKYVDAHRGMYAADTEAAKQAASAQRPAGVDEVTSATWTAVARVLLNLDEFITRE